MDIAGNNAAIGRKRILSLDSLRGIAALNVIFSHYALFMPLKDLPTWVMIFLRSVSLGPEAVILFFCMSGYVLYVQLEGGGTYSKFIIKRICRIYPPYVFAMCIGIAMEVLFHPHLDPSMIFFVNMLWTTPLSFQIIAPSILLIFPFNTSIIDPVAWSLVYEMRISCMFPMLCLFAQRFSWKSLVVFSLILLYVDGMFMVMHHSSGNSENGFGSWSHTLAYIIDFVAGASIAAHRGVIASYLDAKKKLVSGLCLSGLILIEVMGFYSRHLPDFYSVGWHLGLLVAITLILIGVTNHEHVGNFLERGVFVWLGKISYSLYLLHAIVLVAVVRLIGSQSSSLIALAVAFAATLVFSTLSYMFIELPSVGFGRLLLRYISRKASP